MPTLVWLSVNHPMVLAPSLCLCVHACSVVYIHHSAQGRSKDNLGNWFSSVTSCDAGMEQRPSDLPVPPLPSQPPLSHYLRLKRMRHLQLRGLSTKLERWSQFKPRLSDSAQPNTACNPSTGEAESGDLCAFENSLVTRIAGATQRNPVSKKQKKKISILQV